MSFTIKNCFILVMTEKWLYNASKRQRANSWLLQVPVIIAGWGSASHVWPKMLQAMWGWNKCAQISFREGLVAQLWDGTPAVCSFRICLSCRDNLMMPCHSRDWVKRGTKAQHSAWYGRLWGASLPLELSLCSTFLLPLPFSADLS